MLAMDANSLLTCWERGRSRHALDRALLLHAFAAPDLSPDTLADRTLGERNAALLRFRQVLFGDMLSSCLNCPECNESLEFALSVNALLAREMKRATHVCVDGIQLRVPTTRDLVSISDEADEVSAERKLLERLVCVDQASSSTNEGVIAMRGALHPERVTSALDEADPCIDLAVEVTCPACAHAWNAPLDVAAFLWEEIDARARRLLDEVHVLARAYGWAETQILQLTDARRGAYLERVLA